MPSCARREAPPAIVLARLGGSAREVARVTTRQGILHGGFRNGVQHDPVTYVLAALQDRFAVLDQPTCLASMMEMLAVQAIRPLPY